MSKTSSVSSQFNSKNADAKVGVLYSDASTKAQRSLTLTAKFSSAHFYRQPAWSVEKNKSEFGRCFTEHGHGHNYKFVVDVYLPSEIDRKNILQWSSWAQAELQKITKPLDHEHLNFVIPYFQDHVPTTENILFYLSLQIQISELQSFAYCARLFEMEDLWTQMDLTK